MRVMESKYTELALYGSNNECVRTDTVFLPISEVCDGMVSLKGLGPRLIEVDPDSEPYLLVNI